jgi:hypothetical protein
MSMKSLAGAVAIVLFFAIGTVIANAEPRSSGTMNDVVNFWELSVFDCK